LFNLLQPRANCAKPLKAQASQPPLCGYSHDIYILANPLIIYALNVHHNMGMGGKSLK